MNGHNTHTHFCMQAKQVFSSTPQYGMTACSQPNICSDWSVDAVPVGKDFEQSFLFTGSPQITKWKHVAPDACVLPSAHDGDIPKVKQALSTSGHNSEHSPFLATLFPSKGEPTCSLLPMTQLSPLLTDLASCQVTSPTYSEAV